MDKIWLSNYPADVPVEINPDQYSSLVELFEKAVQRFSERPAYINMSKVITFRHLERKSRALAAYLQNELQLVKGDRVALMMPNLLQYPIAMLAILRAGLTVVNVNPLYTPRELEAQLNDSGAKTIITVCNFAYALEQILHKTAVKHVILSRIGDMLSPAKRSLINFGIKYIKKVEPKYRLPNAISFRSALYIGKRRKYVKPYISPSDLAFLQYTGGTTGISKGAMLTHRNMLANVEQVKAFYSPRLKGENEFVLTALPLYHVLALTVNSLLFIELGGCNLLITNPRDLPKLVKEIARYPLTAIIGVNTLFNALLNNSEFCQLDFSNLHLTAGGGMSVQKAVAERWKKITNTNILEGYGLTECSPIVAIQPHTTEIHDGTIGAPVPSTEIRIVDEQMQDVAIGEPGELLVKGPQVMFGYWNRPEATAEIMYQGYLRTGDIVVINQQGFLRIVDRKKDMISVSGFNVYPNEIEDVLVLEPRILECAAVGVTDEVCGEKVKAFIVKKDPSLTEDDVIQHCRKHLTGYKIPRLIEFRTTLPKSNVGKILRKELREK